jgi:NTP pyrophosphatase (non-canonical NTP hydrolase)
MHLNYYSLKAMETALYPEDAAITYPALALSEEVGEVNGKLAKYIRKGGDIHDIPLELRLALLAELGDVLWQLNALSVGLGFSLNEVASHNLMKLADRHDRGVIQGEGDNR